MTFDRSNLPALRRRIQTDLDKIAAELGVSIKLGTGTFSATNVTFKMEVAAIGEGGTILNREAEDFKRFARIYGMDAQDLGRKTIVGGRTYEIVGLASKSVKYPILAKLCSSGTIYKLPSHSVKAGLATANPPTTPQV
jgi:hypothetical protein